MTLIGDSTKKPEAVDLAQVDDATAVDESQMITLIIPTRNEAHGIADLVARLRTSVRRRTEVIFVDDSDDTTPLEVRLQIGNATPKERAHLDLKLVHRPPGHRDGGLGTAVQHGMRLARGTFMCVLDGDLQHPPEVIDALIDKAEQDELDVVVGSRYVDGGSIQTMSAIRQMMSKGCAGAAHVVFPRRLAGVSDPLSGFFAMRRSAIDVDRLEPHGFKILLEVLGRHPDLRTGEVGFIFADRYAGLSKASVREALRYGHQLATLRVAQSQEHDGRAKVAVAYYDIHGILTVSSEVPLPELKVFRVRTAIPEPDIVVTIAAHDEQQDRDNQSLIDLDELHPRMRYVENFGSAGFTADVEWGQQIRVAVSNFVANSPHVAYTNVVEPILRWSVVTRGYAMIHAAGYVQDGRAHLITARTDTGKTTTMLKILENDHTSFISDDLILVDRSGTVFCYPKPLTISAHTVAALSDTDLNRIERFFLPLQSRLHSRAGRQFAFFLSGRKLPVATLNTFIQRVIPPPKYRVEKLVPGAQIESSAAIGSLSIIQRGDEETIEQVGHATGLDLLRENCEDAFGFPPYEQLAQLLQRDPEGRDLVAVEREIVDAAFADVPMSLVTSASMAWAEQIWSAANDRSVAVDGDSPNGHKSA